MEENNLTQGREGGNAVTLESLVTQPYHTLKEAGIVPEKIITVLPVEQYVSLFERRYKNEEPFREIVHTYLGLSNFERFKLDVGEIFLPSWHRKKTGGLVRDYATYIREELVKAVGIQSEILAIKRQHEQNIVKKGEIEKISLEVAKAEEEKTSVEQNQSAVIDEIDRQYAQKKEEMQAAIERERERIRNETDARAIVREKIERRIKYSPLIKVRETGEWSFDDDKLAKRLEDVFLDGIIKDIERNEGSGFMAKVKRNFEGVISYYDQIEGLFELSNVDWVQSIILSRTKGYKLPTFPYLISGKPEIKDELTAAIDTAISVDSSGSMDEHNRWQMAQKAALATNALMRRISPKNKIYMSHHGNDTISNMTSAEFIKSIKPYDGTPTHLGLNRMFEQLCSSKLGIAYLISDGEPNDCYWQQTLDAAKRYSNVDNILLRIFLIDPNDSSEEKVRKIGAAAGSNTKVMSIKNYHLPNGMIKDVSDAMGEFLSIKSF